MIRVKGTKLFILPWLERFLSSFCSLVLLIKTVSTYVISIWAYISFITHILQKKRKLAEVALRLAEAERDSS